MPWTEINGVPTFVAADATTDATTSPSPTPGPGGGKKSWVARHKILTGVGAGVAALAIIGAVAPSDPATSPSSQAQPAQSQTQPAVQKPEQPITQPEKPAEAEAQPDPEPEPAAEEVEPEKPSMTAAQSNAVRKAESYLDFTSFSRKGLIDQLKFDGFSTADATYAVDHVDVSWNEQAEKKAKSYLDFTAFSRSGLIDQLVFDGFTSAQARHGVTAAGL